MVQLYVGIEENKGKSYITIPIKECATAEEAIKIANRLYFKAKIEDLDYAKGYVAKGMLLIKDWASENNCNVWVVARK